MDYKSNNKTGEERELIYKTAAVIKKIHDDFLNYRQQNEQK